MKYNGVIVFAMLAAIAWQKRTMRSFVIAAAPVVSMIVWAIFGAVRYGSPHVIALQKLQAGGLNPLPAIAAAFGLAVLPIVAWAGAQIDRRALFGGLAIGMVSAATAAAWLDYPIGSSILYGVACGATAAFLLQIRSRDAVLIVWLLAPVVLQFGQRFTSVRYLIAMLPPALLLWRPASRIRLAIGAAIGAILVVALSAADATTANVYRDFVREHRTDRYSGHWGLQYYAEQRGERAVERGENVRDSVTVAKHAFPPVVVDGTTFPVNISIPIRTIDCAAAANFYGNAIANCEHYPIYLPFGFSRREVETFVISDRQP